MFKMYRNESEKEKRVIKDYLEREILEQERSTKKRL